METRIDRFVRSYMIHLEAEGRSPKTIAWHRYNLGKFALWLKARGLADASDDWDHNLVKEFFVHETRRPSKRGGTFAPHTLKTLGSSLRSFFKWLKDDERIERDVFAKVTVPKAPKLAKANLTTQEIRRVLAAARDSRYPLRDQAVVLFLLDTGARADEVCRLRLDAVDFDQRIARLFGKGAKERYVPFSPSTAKAILRYLDRERRGETGRLFESETGGPLTPSGLLRLTKRLGQRAGVGLNPHKFRHTFAISYLRAGASVFALQKVLGHATLDMSLHYSALATDDLIASHRAHSPVEAVLSSAARRRKDEVR